MAKLDIPLDALKLVTQNAPEEAYPTLAWTNENGFVLNMNVGGQLTQVRFDYGETLEDIKREIQMVSGITLPSEEKKEKGSSPQESPGESKEASMETPFLDKIAVLGNLQRGVLTDHRNQVNSLAAEMSGTRTMPNTTTPTRTVRPVSSAIRNIGSSLSRLKPR